MVAAKKVRDMKVDDRIHNLTQEEARALYREGYRQCVQIARWKENGTWTVMRTA